MFKGTYTALITPFANGKVDEKAFQRLVEWQIEEGIHGLVPCGTTGESPTLSHDEHHHVIDLCIDMTAGRVPVLAGTGSNSTAEAVELAISAEKSRADGLLIVTPYYNKPTQEGLYQHYKAINDAVGIPIILYNIPGRSVIDMSDETILRLAELKNIKGIKDASGNLERPARLRMHLGDDFVQFSGDDSTALAFNAQGGHGCISVTSNIAPNLCAELQNNWHQGHFKEALAIHDKLMPLHLAMFSETSPGPVKYAAHLMGLCEADIRLPLVQPGKASKNRVRDVLQQLGMIAA